MDTKMILEDNIVLYLGVDNLADPIVGSAIGSIMLADLTAVASDRYNFDNKPPKVNGGGISEARHSQHAVG